MHDKTNMETALPVLLTTQLMAAEVYSRFVSMTEGEERDLWKMMLAEEVDHIVYLRNVMSTSFPQNMSLPFVNADRIAEVCERATLHGMTSFMLRLEGALRLECAELDYGLEALAAKRLSKSDLIIDYPGNIVKHLDDLMYYAKKYQASPNISRLITRVEDLYESSVSGTTAIIREVQP